MFEEERQFLNELGNYSEGEIEKITDETLLAYKQIPKNKKMILFNGIFRARKLHDLISPLKSRMKIREQYSDALLKSVKHGMKMIEALEPWSQYIEPQKMDTIIGFCKGLIEEHKKISSSLIFKFEPKGAGTKDMGQYVLVESLATTFNEIFPNGKATVGKHKEPSLFEGFLEFLWDNYYHKKIGKGRVQKTTISSVLKNLSESNLD